MKTYFLNLVIVVVLLLLTELLEEWRTKRKDHVMLLS